VLIGNKAGKTHEIANERQMLTRLHNNNIVKMYSAFQDKKKLYFVLDYAINGDLEGFLNRQCKVSNHHCRTS